MTYTGNVRKMRVQLEQPVSYTLNLDEAEVDMNALVGQPIELKYLGEIHCKICGRKTKKSFGQGFCFKHFRDAPENSECIIRPELCEGHLGKGRDPEWEQIHHVQPHVVYLAVASGLKVGVTREQQVPTRWIDQGAWKAIRLAETPHRRLAGEIEVALKNHISDKTHWQKMLKNVLATDLDLLEEKARMTELIPEALRVHASENDEIVEIEYPVQQFPTKVKSINFDKQDTLAGTLQGIKGQYLLFDEGRVINLRKHTGYRVQLSV